MRVQARLTGPGQVEAYSSSLSDFDNRLSIPEYDHRVLGSSEAARRQIPTALTDFSRLLDTFTGQSYSCDLCDGWIGHSQAEAEEHRRLMNTGKSADSQWYHVVRARASC
jgi:hypothetical protein